MAIAEAEIVTRRPTGITSDAEPNGLPKAAVSPVAPAVQCPAIINEPPISITVKLPDGVEVVKVSPGVLDSMRRLLTPAQQQDAFKDWAKKERFLKKELAELENKKPPMEGAVILDKPIVYLAEEAPGADPSRAPGYAYGRELPQHPIYKGFKMRY